MAIQGAQLANALGNIVEYNDMKDFGTGYSPAAAAVTAPTNKPVPGFDLR